MNIIVFLLIGAFAGWIASRIMEGGSFGLLGNVIVGVIGSFLGRYLAGVVGIDVEGGIFTSLLTAVIGAVILLFVVGIIKNMIKK
ncbi:MAG: GlsB/YeaQ/YmgE family stress response membrane protein [Candidatus Krumholzibacteriota bacterium]